MNAESGTSTVSRLLYLHSLSVRFVSTVQHYATARFFPYLFVLEHIMQPGHTPVTREGPHRRDLHFEVIHVLFAHKFDFGDGLARPQTPTVLLPTPPHHPRHPVAQDFSQLVPIFQVLVGLPEDAPRQRAVLIRARAPTGGPTSRMASRARLLCRGVVGCLGNSGGYSYPLIQVCLLTGSFAEGL